MKLKMELSPEQADQVRLGYKGRSQDEKWNLTCDENKLIISRRSWTDIKFYTAYFENGQTGEMYVYKYRIHISLRSILAIILWWPFHKDGVRNIILRAAQQRDEGFR